MHVNLPVWWKEVTLPNLQSLLRPNSSPLLSRCCGFTNMFTGSEERAHYYEFLLTNSCLPLRWVDWHPVYTSMCVPTSPRRQCEAQLLQSFVNLAELDVFITLYLKV